MSKAPPKSDRKLDSWLLGQKDTLEKIVAETATEGFEKEFKGFENHEYEISECQEEFFQLGKGGDLYYDRYSVGWIYSTWYHLRRVNGLLKTIVHEWCSAKIKPDCIIDLGCGTGATIWSVGLLWTGLTELGHRLSPLRVINLDSSPFMLYYSRFLWDSFCNTYPSAKKIHVEFSLRSWNSPQAISVKDSWFFANYLFDAESDWKFLCDEFSKVATESKPSRLFLRTSKQKSKTIDRVADSLGPSGYSKHSEKEEIVYEGIVNHLKQFRESISGGTDFNLTGKPEWEPNRTGEYSFVLKRKATQANFNLDEISIGRCSNKDINQIELNKEQAQLAKIRSSPFPLDISGPAGCGKSLVLAKAIESLVKSKSKKINKVLLTTFNKELKELFASWLRMLLPDWKCITPALGQYLLSSNKSEDSIEILHFDIIPTRVFRLSANIITDEQDIGLATESIEEYCNVKGINRSELPKSINAQSLIQFYVRYYYGNGWKTLEQFEEGTMDKDFSIKVPTRAVVFDLLKNYVRKFSSNKDTFTTVRDRCLKLVADRNVDHEKPYTYVFLDEFQDCSISDLKILLGLVENPNCVTIAGDFSQAVHLGKKAQQLLANLGNELKLHSMKQWQHRNLDGSYRLPFRVSDCLKPLSDHLSASNSGNVIHSYPGGPPGARPLLIKASNVQSCGAKIADALFFYRSYAGEKPRVTILEPDPELGQAIRKGWNAILMRLNPSDKERQMGKFFLGISNDTVLRIKGLEMPFVVWSSRICPKTGDDEADEFAYTAMTRTSAVLIIAVIEKPYLENENALNLLNKKFLIPWDIESQNYLNTMNSNSEEAIPF